MAKAVLVVDMLRCFLERGYPMYVGDKARGIIPNIQRRLERELKAGSKVFFIGDRHGPDDLEFRMFPPHCLEGTPEAEVVPELAEYAGEIIPKKRYSSFFDTSLGEQLSKLRPNKLVVCGVLTDVCVLHTVADARNRDYEVEVPLDCVASSDERAHRFALEHMEKVLGAKLISPRARRPKPAKFEPSEAVLSGDTADIYFVRTLEILKRAKLNPVATIEVFPGQAGVLCGIEEVKALLARVLPEGNREVWALAEGESICRVRGCRRGDTHH